MTVSPIFFIKAHNLNKTINLRGGSSKLHGRGKWLVFKIKFLFIGSLNNVLFFLGQVNNVLITLINNTF